MIVGQTVKTIAKDAGVDAGLVPRPHLGPGEPAQRGDGWRGERAQE